MRAKSLVNYYPFGMVMPGREYSSAEYKFGFNGKENESSWSHTVDFGERFFNTSLGRSFSVDKLKYLNPGGSPYSVSANNPLFFIDFEGNIIAIAIGERKYTYRDGALYDERGQVFDHASNTFANSFITATQTILATSTGAQIIERLQSSTTEYIVKEQIAGSDISNFVTENNSIWWNSTASITVMTQNGASGMPSWLALAHEFAHAYMKDQGERDQTEWFNAGGTSFIKDEINACHYENLIRQQNGLGLRTHYTTTTDAMGNPIGFGESKLISERKVKTDNGNVKMIESANDVVDISIQIVPIFETVQVQHGGIGEIKTTTTEIRLVENKKVETKEKRAFTYSVSSE